MKLLLDTNALLWWCGDDARLGKNARKMIKDASDVFVSVVSAWEIVIKSRLGRLQPIDDFLAAIESGAFVKLPLDFSHIDEYDSLPMHHRDPFDRMLVAQARSENLPLLTSDKMLKNYSVSFLDARK